MIVKVLIFTLFHPQKFFSPPVIPFKNEFVFIMLKYGCVVIAVKPASPFFIHLKLVCPLRMADENGVHGKQVRCGNIPLGRNRRRRGGVMKFTGGIFQNGNDSSAVNEGLHVGIFRWRKMCIRDRHDIVRVFGNRARRFERDDEADVLSVTDEKITLKWDCWGVEAFKKMEDGTFYLSSGGRQEEPFSPRKKVAVLFIATGRYMTFWEEFYAASKQYFLTGHDVHYFLFTDHPEVETGDDVTLVRKPFYPLSLIHI